MNDYVMITALAVFYGLVDYNVKGVLVDAGKWAAMPDYLKGWSWHLSIWILYAVTVLLIAPSFRLFFCSILGMMTEDVTYWINRWIVTGKTSLKPPVIGLVDTLADRLWYFGLILFSQWGIFILCK
jgi:hypothetical protein